MLHAWFGLFAPTTSIGLSKDEGYRKQRRLWDVLPSPSSLTNVVVKNMYTVVNEIVASWKEKARQSNGLAFDVLGELRMVLVDVSWRDISDSILDLLAVKYSILGRPRHARICKSRAVASFKCGDMPNFCGIL